MHNIKSGFFEVSDCLVLSSHPISRDFKSIIESKCHHSCKYISLSALKAKGVKSALWYLIKQRPSSTVIVFEEPEDIIFINILCLVSFIFCTPRRLLFMPDRTSVVLSKVAFIKTAANLVLGSLAALKSAVVALMELKSLENFGESSICFEHYSNIIYLNTNVMFGVKAGGSLGHIAGVVNGLFNRKCSVTYVATKLSPVINKAVPLRQLEIPTRMGMPSELFLFGLSQQASRQLGDIFVDRTPAIIYQRMSRCNYTGAMLRQKHKVPLVIEYNGSEVWGARHWGHPMIFERLARKAELVSLRAADLLVTISDVLCDELVEIGIDRSKIVVYPNCVDSQVFDSARFDPDSLHRLRATHGIPDDTLVLGFIGTFGAWHGIDFLCTVIRRLVNERLEWLDKFKVRFLIVGDGHFRGSVERLVRDDIVGRYVVWPGLVEQTEAPMYLAMMDILLSPHVKNPDGTRFFGSPTKLFEYMSMSRPIIAASLDQIAAVLSPGLAAAHLPAGNPGSAAKELAVLTAPGDEDELMSAIAFLVENKDWREVLAQNARREVLEKYQWSNHVEKILEAIDSRADQIDR